MTKRIISILLSVLMIFSTFPVGVFAQEDIELSLGTALVEGADVKVPVTLNKLPDDFDKLASVYMEYSYDSDVLTYVGTENAAIALIDGQSRDGGISWFDSNSSVVADNTVLFYLLFTAADEQTTEIAVTDAELGAANHKLCTPAVNSIKLFESKAAFNLVAQATADTVLVDVYLDKLPGDIEDIAAATISYTYDEDILAYNRTMPGAFALVEGETVKDGNISWFTNTPIDEIDNTYLFTLVFDVVTDTNAATVVGINKVELASSSHAISECVETGKVQIDIVKEDPTKAEVTFGDADITDGMVYVPVYMDKIPSDIKDIGAFTFRYTYSDKLVYSDTRQGKFALNEDSAAAGSVSWMYNTSSPVTDVTNPLFTLVFEIADGAEGDAELDVTFVEVSDSDRKIAANVSGKAYSFTLPPAVQPPVVLTGIIVAPEAFEVPYGADALTAVNAAIVSVMGTYSDGSAAPVSGYSVALNADGTKAIVTYEGKTAEIALTYEAAPVVLTGITVAPVAFEVPYGTVNVLEAVKGAITAVTATYSDGKTAPVTEYAVEISADGAKAIVTYEGKTAEIALTYEPAPTPALSLEAQVVGTKVRVPVSLNMIPEELKDIAAFDMPFTFSEDLLTFAGIEAGKLPVTADFVSGKKVSWFSSTAPVTNVDNDILFTLVFDVKDNVNGTATIAVSGIEITASDRKISTAVELDDASVVVMGGTVVPTIVGIRTNIGEIEIPLNTPDVLAFIKNNIKIIAVYNTGAEEEITDPVDINIVNGSIKVSYGGFDADDVDMTYTKATAKADDAVVDTAVREFNVAVSMDGIPADITDIASLTFEYTYDTAVEYVTTLPGIIPVDENSATAGVVSWFSSTSPVTTVNNGTLFTLVFKAPCDADTEFDIVFDLEIADSNRVVTANIESEKSTVRVSPVPHNWSEWTTTTAPTLEADGVETRVCANCDKEETRPVVLTEIAVTPADFEVPYGADALDAVKAAITEVTATYSDGTTLSAKEVCTVALSADGTKAVVTFKDKTADIALTYVTLDSIAVEPATFEVPYGTEDVLAAVKAAVTAVTASFSNGTTAPVTEYTVALTADGTKAIVTFDNQTAEIALTYVTLTGIELNKTALEVPYRFHSQGADKKMEYVKSQIIAKAVLSDGTKVAISDGDADLTFAEEGAAGTTVTVAYKGVQETVALTLEPQPAKPEVYPDVPVIDEETRDISVAFVVSEIPAELETVEGITHIETIDITYTYDDSKLVYKNTQGADSNLDSDGSEAGKIDIDVNIGIEIDDINHTAKAVIELHAPCNVEGVFTIAVDGLVINGIDVSQYFGFSSIDIPLTAVDCEYGEWYVPAGTDPTDYKNGKEVRDCTVCGGSEERPIRVVEIASAVANGIEVPYEYHYGKTATEIADYIKTLGTLATAKLTTKQQSGDAYTTNLDNADVVVTVDTAANKAVIKYVNAYNPETDTTYDATCEIALTLAANSTPGGNIPGGSIPGGGRPSIGGGFAGGSFAPNVPTTMFNDVPTSHYAYEAIKNLYNRGIVSGDENGNINPDLGITREETAKVALLINGIPVEKGLSIDFKDKAKVSGWAYDYVATAIKYGILKGYDDGTVRPRDTVSREEMVAIVIRALNVQISGSADSKFVDVENGRWSVGYIKAATDLGLITGYGDGTFKPATDIKRAEAFTIYHRVIKFKDSLVAAIK